jgi:heme/copper-type cytochrome/quinol oxidase subunit 2
MTTTAWAMMLVTDILVTVITVYFFVKVLRTPSKEEPDSFSHNDSE